MYINLIPQAVVENLTPYSTDVNANVGTPSGLSINFINKTAYVVGIFDGGTQVDELQPYNYVIRPMSASYTVTLYPAQNSDVYSSNQHVYAVSIAAFVPYTTGSVITSISVRPGTGVPTDVGEGFQLLTGGGIFSLSSGTVSTVTFELPYPNIFNLPTAKQIYLKNMSSIADCYVTASGTAPTLANGALVLSPGDMLGLSWAVTTLWCTSPGTGVDLQVQGWG